MPRRIFVIVLLSLASIVLHEFGHYSVYRLSNIPVHITLQSVRPKIAVGGRVEILGLAAGPAVSLAAAAVFILFARRHRDFFWPTAAFTNATLRLFPCSIDLLHALRNGMPFSDEGDIAAAVTHSPATRALVIACVFALSTILTMMSARQFHFEKRRALKIIGIYSLSLAVGVGVVLIDELLHPMRM